MKGQRGAVLAMVLSAVVLGGCGGDAGPKQIYMGMATAAEFGDLDTFLKGFTDESKKIVQAQLSLSDAYGLKNDNPLSLLVFAAVENVEEQEDKAILTVTRGAIRKRILMVKVPDVGWRIDAKKLADFWDDEKKSKN